MNTTTSWYLGQRTKTAESNYLQDFLAGVDPFGLWSAQYGTQAERAGLSEGEHALKRGLGTVGGIMGGAIGIPSGISGLLGAASGFAEAKGGLGARLSGALSGGIAGAKHPLKSLAAAGRSRQALNRISVSGGTLTPKELDSVKFIGRQIPLGSIDDMRGMGRAAAGQVQDAARNTARAVTSQSPKEVAAGASSKFRNLFKNITESDTSIDDLGEFAQEQARTYAGAGGPATQMQRHLAQKSIKPLNSAIASGAAALGLGGGVGGFGAFAQYGAGRNAERDTTIGARVKRRLGMEN